MGQETSDIKFCLSEKWNNRTEEEKGMNKLDELYRNNLATLKL